MPLFLLLLNFLMSTPLTLYFRSRFQNSSSGARPVMPTSLIRSSR